MILGLTILVAAVVAGVPGNGGTGHALTHPFAVSGYHVTGSTGTPFPYGIVVGALALLRPRGEPTRRPRTWKLAGAAA